MITLTSYFIGAFALGWSIGAGWLFFKRLSEETVS